MAGRGNDTFNINGNVRNTIYDYKYDTNYVKHSSRTKNQISTDRNVNRYDITGFNYNKYRLPISVAFNDEDKLFAGLGYSLTTFSFRKDPYSTYQRIIGTLQFQYPQIPGKL